MNSAKVTAPVRTAAQARANARATELADTVRELRAAGRTTLRGIAEGLNHYGIPAPRGGGWSAKQVLRLLKRMDSLS